MVKQMNRQKSKMSISTLHLETLMFKYRTTMPSVGHLQKRQ